MEAISLDVHAHLVPICAEALTAFDGVRWQASSQKLTVDGHILGAASLFDPDALLRWMVEQGVERAWISVPPPVYRQHLAAADALRWASYLNDGLRAIAGRCAGRLQVLLHLPLEQPEAALAVLASCNQAAEANAEVVAGYAASTTVGIGTLADAALEPVWRALNDRKAFLFLHPGDCADPRLKAFYQQNLLGNPHETAVAVGALVFGGVLERFEHLRICLSHGGGTTPVLAGRWQRGFDTARPGLDLQGTPPRAALKRLWVDCIMHDDAALQCACTIFGADRVLFGSDWPFPMGLIDPGTQCAAWPAATRRQIFSENVRKLLDSNSGH